MATFAHKNPALEAVGHVEIPVNSGWSALQVPLWPCLLGFAIILTFTFFKNALSGMFLSESIAVREQCSHVIMYTRAHPGNTGRRLRNVLNSQAGVRKKANSVSS